MYEQVNALDPVFTAQIIDNALIQLLKTGFVEKRSDGGMFTSWEERFLLLTDAGLIYFKKNNDQPQKYKTLNNFIVQAIDGAAAKKAGRMFMFKI